MVIDNSSLYALDYYWTQKTTRQLGQLVMQVMTYKVN